MTAKGYYVPTCSNLFSLCFPFLFDCGRRRLLAVLWLLLLCCAGVACAQTAPLTFTGVWSYVTYAGMSQPHGIAGDAAGNLYIVDSGVGSVIKIASNGTESNVGVGLIAPGGIASDAAGNLYIADTGNQRIVSIPTNGIQTTIASGWDHPTSVAVDNAGNLYVADATGLSKVSSGGTKTVLVSAGNQAITAVTVDATGDVFYSDNSVNYVYEILSGTTTPEIHNAISGIVLSLYADAADNVFLGAQGVGVLRSDDSQGDTTLFGDTLRPNGIWEDGAHNLYIADAAGQVRKLALGAVDFGSVNVCPTTSMASQCVTSRTLNYALDSASSVNVSGASALSQGIVDLDYTVASNSCTGALSQGGGCAVTVAFSPTTAGLRMGAAELLGVVAGPPTISCSANPSFVFPGDSSTITAIATSPAGLPLTYSYSSSGGSISGNSSVAILSTVGSPPGTITLTCNVVDTQGQTASATTSVTVAGPAFLPATLANSLSVQPSGLSGRVSSPSGLARTALRENGSTYPALSSSASLLVTTYLHGVGLAAQGVFDTAPISTLPAVLQSGGSAASVAVDANGKVYVLDEQHCNLQSYDGSTTVVVAGTGICAAPSGDGSAATSATLYDPRKIALDGAGNLYIADAGGHNVRRIDGASGVITTAAGSSSGQGGYTPDGGQATASLLDTVAAVAVDGAGNLYLGDLDHSLVRKVDVLSGLLSTVAGNYQAGVGYSGDGAAATNAQLHDPNGLAVDNAGNIYIADSSNNVVREVTASTGIITTIAGNQAAGCGYSESDGAAINAKMCGPKGVSLDGAGNVYIADSSNNLVRKINQATHILTTVAGTYNGGTDAYSGDGGAATHAGLSHLLDIAIDGSGNLLIADTDNRVIREVATGSGILNLGSVNVGSTSAAQDVTLTNDGNSALSLSALQTPVDFNLGGSDTSCTASTTLAAGASCVLGVEFAPTVSGLLSENLTLTDNNGNAAAVTQTIALSGSAVQLVPTQVVLSVLPGPLTAGGNLGLLNVRVEAANGSTVTNSSAPVTVTISSSAGYSQTLTGMAVNGVATLDASSLNLTASGSYFVTASSPTLNSDEAVARVNPGPASKLVPSALPATLTSGANLGNETVAVQDVYSNPVYATTTVTLTITGPAGYSQTLTGRNSDGPARFNLSSLPLTTAGVYTVTASSVGLPSVSSPVTVTAGTGSQIALGSVPSSITSGQSLGTTTVTIEDASGNTATSFSGPITATLSGPNGFSQVVNGTAVNGVANLSLAALSPTAAGTYTLTAMGAGLTSATAAVTVVPAPQSIALPSLTNVTYGAVVPTLPTSSSAGLPVTYTVTGPAVLNGSSLIVSGAGTVTLTATQAGDSAHTPVTVTKTFVVAQAPTTTTLSTSGNVVALGTSVIFTAHVASSAGVPTGTVTFLNGTAVLGMGAVSTTGAATLTLSTLPAGALNIAASYSGDANYLTSLSTIDATAVQDFGIAATSGSPSVPVVPGTAADFTVALTPGTAGFSSTITLTATGLPTGATYSFSPATVTPGSATASTVLTVQTTKPVTTARKLEGAAGIAFALLFVPFGISRKGREALRKSRPLNAFGILLLLGGLAGLTGCGTSNGFFGQPGASYTITVTGTSGTLVHSTTVVLNVQ